MEWEIKWKPGPLKFLDNLPKDEVIRVLNKLEEVKIDPFRYLEHFEGKYYKLRIGKLRILIDIDFNNKYLFIEIFDKRGRIYR
jgi:mRNA-degrading endonuclease RelE of RelBE toxin-antitoxin system